MPKATTRKCTAISLETKKALCECKLKHPHYKAKNLIDIFKLNVDRSTVTKTDEIVELINKRYNRDPDNDVESDNEELPPLLSPQKGKAGLEVALQYCEEQYSGRVDANFFRTLRTLIRDTAQKVQDEKKQMQLDSFFHINE
jgi:hypothetical protein